MNLMSLLDFSKPATMTSSGHVARRCGDTLMLAYRQAYRVNTESCQ